MHPPHLEHTGCMQSAKASNSKCIYFIVKVKAREVILAFANQLLQNSLSYKGLKVNVRIKDLQTTIHLPFGA